MLAAMALARPTPGQRAAAAVVQRCNGQGRDALLTDHGRQGRESGRRKEGDTAGELRLSERNLPAETGRAPREEGSKSSDAGMRQL